MLPTLTGRSPSLSKLLAGYTALRSYTGKADAVTLTAKGVAGIFYRDDADTTSTDNGATVIVASNGKRWKRADARAFDPAWLAADNTGTADSSAAIVSTFAAAQTAHKPVRFPGEKFKLTSAVALPYHVEADFGQAFIDASGVAGGLYAITAKNLAGATTLQYPSVWKGLRLDLGTSLAYGVKVEAPTGQWAVSNFSAENWNIKGGAVGLGFGENTWLCNFRNVAIGGQSSIGIDARLGVNAGESMNFTGGVVSGVKNGSVTGVGFKSDLLVTRGTWKFFGFSFDYCDQNIEHTDGTLELHGCHVESDGAAPLAKLTQVTGRAVLNFNAFGTEWYSKPGSTRTDIIRVSGNPVINIQGGSCVAIGSTENLEFVSVPTAADAPSINIKGVNFGLFPGIANTVGRICGKTSLVRNGNFETGTALDFWRMDPVNFLRNGAFSGGVSGVIGSGGQWPTGMGLVGSLNGLNQPTLTFTSSGGRPVMQVRFTGTPTSSASTGIYFYNGVDVVTQRLELWKLRTYLRLTAAAVGVNSFALQLTERNSGGSAVVSGSTNVVPTTDRKLFTYGPYAVQDATAAYLHSAMNFTYTTGVAVDFTIEIDIPSLMLAPMDYADIIRSDTSATLPSYRVQHEPTAGRGTGKCLRLYSSVPESVGVFSVVPVRSNDWLFARGYAWLTAAVSGGAGLKVSWRDNQDNEISNQGIRASYLSGVGGTFAQHSGVRVAPAGAERARLMCWFEAFQGTVSFDDIEAWVI